MIQPFLEEGAWCYWVVSIGALLCFLGLVVACICSCRRNENKNEFLGLAGMVTLNDSDNDGFNGIPMADALSVATHDIVDNGKRSTSANRSLPDIPKDKGKKHENTDVFVSQDIYEITETIGDHSELYATVRDTGKEQVSELDVPEILHQNPLTQENSDDQYLRFASSPNSDNVEHPYAQLQNIQKTEASRSSRNNIKQIIDVEKPSTSTGQINGNPVAPPRTRRSSSHNSLSTETTGPCDIQAANAISGGVQANQDLPYMTPPLLMLLSQPLQSLSNSPQQHFSGDSQDSKGYTSISVREPLANIIAQTKTICQQSQSIRPLTDPHYATVSDDSDEMYAAIDEQDKVYTSGSETYAQIQPTITEIQRVQNEQMLFTRVPSRSDETYPVPQPPSVDSLRYVAHAHSRQASSSSANSSIINPGSPKPEKRQANSPLPLPPEGTAEVYASIEKRAKNEDRLKLALSNGKSLEDMYAKVMKKKKDVEEQQNDTHSISQGNLHSELFDIDSVQKPCLIESNNKALSSSHDFMEIQKKESDILNDNNFHPNTENLIKSYCSTFKNSDCADPVPFQLDHGYETMESDLFQKHLVVRESCDPNYEVLCPQQCVTTEPVSNSSVSISPRNNAVELPVTSSASSSFSSSPFSLSSPPLSTASFPSCSSAPLASTLSSSSSSSTSSSSASSAPASTLTSTSVPVPVPVPSPAPAPALAPTPTPTLTPTPTPALAPTVASASTSASTSISTSLSSSTPTPTSASASTPTPASALTPTTSTSTPTSTSASIFSSSPPSSYAVPFKHRQISNASSEDPGYEKVRLRKRSEIDQDTDSEPNYESMPHDSGEPNYASVCRPVDSDTDPNYESVNHGDPNYETVKYTSVNCSEEPPYELVNTYKTDHNTNGYEKVNKHILFTVDYEQLHQNHSTESINGDTDDEQYVQV